MPKNSKTLKAPKPKNSKSLKAPKPIRGKKGATIMGPKNRARARQDRDLISPPSTDNGNVLNLRWSFEDSAMRLSPGGWSRQVTARELPSSTGFAGVNMRLTAGGVREMHWHKEPEWAFMIKGNARITVVDQFGHAFQNDVTEGDLWFFPAGIPHSIQGLGPDGCEFLLVFNDGQFSEDSTFLLTDWFAHTPREVLAKNFGVLEKAFAHIPKEELYIFQASVPGPLRHDRVKGTGRMREPLTYRMLEQKPLTFKHGKVRIVDSSVFPASKTIAAALVEVNPGGMRELHWHPNGTEWQYYISGKARMTVFAAEGNARTFDFQAGDVGIVPFPMGHYIENTGNTTLRFLEIFNSSYFADVSLAQWLKFTPNELVRAHLHIDESVLAKIPVEKTPVV